GGGGARVVATGTGSSPPPPTAAVQAERCDKGMCLLAAVAAHRALEEAQQQAQRRHCGVAVQGQGQPLPPFSSPGLGSTERSTAGVPCSSLSVAGTALRGAKHDASLNPEHGSASDFTRKRARPRVSGSDPPPGTPRARATTASAVVGKPVAAQVKKENAMAALAGKVGGGRVPPLPWRPRELRFLVGVKKVEGVSAGGVQAPLPPPQQLALPLAQQLELPLATPAPAAVGVTAGKEAGLQRGQEGKTPGKEE
ncbi:unnamed protein product, partial [Laminaria digitata]